ncbi:polysaccharide biosynthesis C-terminal domain-containing protein [Maritalea porphyrae]|uniref:oligosaccharide flippase family protein n=1 Tax=Maritalea porphyrae TaxID=880732 RepID=UPI0022AFFD95|nr:polysaccharide biosynthesis C-terminal domain-containing protein [Maritalea porphyrae]MCZ4271983.1 polysaccharide biosynthesis C-terminal domain-containing protein [Maritalea porphyrae]
MIAKLYQRTATLLSRVGQLQAVLQAMSALLTRILAAGLAYVFQIYLAKSLGIEHYGIFVTFWTWQVILTHVSVMGFSESAVRFLPRYATRLREDLIYGFMSNGLKFIIATSLATALMCGAALYFFSDLLADNMTGSAIVLAVGLPVLALELYIEGVARGLGWIWLAVVPGFIVRPVIVMATLFVISLNGFPLTAELALAVSIGVTLFLVCLQAIFIKLHVRRIKPKTSQNHRARLRRYWIYAAVPLVVVTGVEELLYWSDIVILGFMMPSENVSIYFAALRCMAIAGFIHYAFMMVFAREFSLANAQGDKTELQTRVHMASTWTFWLTIPAVLVTLAAGPILLSLFGEEFASGQTIMLIIGIGLVGKSLVGQASNLLIVVGRERLNVLIAGYALIMNIALSVLLVPIMGIAGAAVGTAASQIIRAALLYYYCKSKINVSVLAHFDPRKVLTAKAS